MGRNERETNIRAIPHKGKKAAAFNGNFALDLERVPRWQAGGRGIYLQVNPGGTKAAEVTAGIALFFEYDTMARDKQLGIWDELEFPQPSFQVDTGGKSIHHYYVLAQPIEVSLWTELMERLINSAPGCDMSCKGANRLMRLAGGYYIDRHGVAIDQSRIVNASGKRYSAQQLDQHLPNLAAPEPRHQHTGCGRPPKPKQRKEAANLRVIGEALDCIPRRTAGGGTYADYRTILWGLKAACADAGYGDEVAIELMESHSPSHQCGWDVTQVCRSGGEQITAGSFWWHAQQAGWRPCHE
ncbi:hypothetical protein SynMEDNS5_01776 [Synechococcus sp. MEDNS5]|nr:hypothetical protein SynMEDNS5_01776 [Synechococcus sp. MEDNS5]